MRIYVICTVRIRTKDQENIVSEYVGRLRDQGHIVFYPTEDAPQNDITGYDIIITELEAIKAADRIDIFWSEDSKGSHFDLGAAMALEKDINLIYEFTEDGPDKSYAKVIKLYQKINCAPGK